jgi:hypothetical protein
MHACISPSMDSSPSTEFLSRLTVWIKVAARREEVCHTAGGTWTQVNVSLHSDIVSQQTQYHGHCEKLWSVNLHVGIDGALCAEAVHSSRVEAARMLVR